MIQLGIVGENGVNPATLEDLVLIGRPSNKHDDDDGAASKDSSNHATTHDVTSHAIYKTYDNSSEESVGASMTALSEGTFDTAHIVHLFSAAV